MDSDVVLRVESINKVFKIPHERRTSLKQHFVNLFRRVRYRRFEAIRSVSFEIHRGEFFSIIGQNGSGKSTLLKILAGIYTPTKGKVSVNGRLSPFIELGVGFSMDLTARENIFLNGAILGLSRDEINAKFNEILDFAELQEFVDQKLKNFSSGMLVRLAFSIAIQAHAEILLIDEVLAVGDANFQQKCFDVFRRLKAEGRTIIFVSHDLGSVKEFSDRVLLLNAGVDYGIFSAQEAIAKYSELNQERVNRDLERHGVELPPSAEGLQVEEVSLHDSSGITHALTRGESASVQLKIRNPREVPLAVGVAIYRNDGLYCFGTNTDVDNFKLKPGQKKIVSIEYPHLNLQSGSYYLVLGLFGPDVVYQMLEHVLTFQISGQDGSEGMVYLEHSWRED